MYSQKLIMEASELNLSAKEMIVIHLIEKYERLDSKDIDLILNRLSLPTLSMNDVIDIAGELIIRTNNGNILQRGVANSKKLRGFEETRVLEGHPSRCIDKECFDCSGCRLDETLSCSPGCNVLDPVTGEIDNTYCITECDAQLNSFIVVEYSQNGENDIYKGQVEAPNYDEATKLAIEKYSIDESRLGIYRLG